MKNVIKIIMYLIFAVNLNVACLPAAMDDKISADSDMAIHDIVYERNRAQQEYQQYIRDKSTKPDRPVVVPAEHVTRTAEDVPSRRWFTAGIVLLVVALILTVYLYYISKNKKNK